MNKTRASNLCPHRPARNHGWSQPLRRVSIDIEPDKRFQTERRRGSQLGYIPARPDPDPNSSSSSSAPADPPPELGACACRLREFQAETKRVAHTQGGEQKTKQAGRHITSHRAAEKAKKRYLKKKQETSEMKSTIYNKSAPFAEFREGEVDHCYSTSIWCLRFAAACTHLHHNPCPEIVTGIDILGYIHMYSNSSTSPPNHLRTPSTPIPAVTREHCWRFLPAMVAAAG
jgi:hypothetical protein